MRIGKDTQRKFIISLILGLFVYVVLAVFGDVKSVGESLRSFKWWMLPVVLTCALGNYAFRLTRWHYYLKLLHIPLPFRDSVTVFMSGLAMSITPGKFGELVKAFFLKKMTGTPVRRSVPVVFAERFTDLFSIVALAAVGAFSLQHGQKLVWFGLAITIGGLVVVMNRPVTLRLIAWITKLPGLHGRSEQLHDLYEHAYTLLRFKPLTIAFALGVMSWFCECIGLYVTFWAFGHPMELWHATFIYAFATFFGAVTFLPGGLGTTEGTLTGLAMLQGTPKDVASAATIVIRLATLWFAVALGLLWLAPNREALIPDKTTLTEMAEN